MSDWKGKEGLNLRVYIAIGLAWGLAEAGLGIGLRSLCPGAITGSVMTGTAFLFLASACYLRDNFRSLAVLLGIVVALKGISGILLGQSILHGAVLNPVFAFLLESAVFVAMVWTLRRLRSERPLALAVGGGLAGAAAAAVFPVAGMLTGSPVCRVAGTAWPVSVYYAPVAAAVAFLCVPLGWAAGRAMARVMDAPGRKWRLSPAVLDLASGAALAGILAITLLTR